MIVSGVLIAGLTAGSVAAEPLQTAQATPLPPVAQPPKAKAPAATPTGEDSALQRRVDQLEEQLVDMQVVIGTLESLARGGGGAAPAADGASYGGGGADGVRIDGLETQLRALAAQVQQLTEQVRALGGQPRRSDLAPSQEPAAAQPPTTRCGAARGAACRRGRGGARRRRTIRLHDGHGGEWRGFDRWLAGERPAERHERRRCGRRDVDGRGGRRGGGPGSGRSCGVSGPGDGGAAAGIRSCHCAERWGRSRQRQATL
ncbi:MAG: hypothetical protein WDN31_17255 [Hyphomicrobium sp.]